MIQGRVVDGWMLLEVPYFERLRVHLADGSGVDVDVHIATIDWDGRVIDAAVLAMGERPLLGSALVAGFNLNADLVDGGVVSLTRL